MITPGSLKQKAQLPEGTVMDAPVIGALDVEYIDWTFIGRWSELKTIAPLAS